MDKNIKHVRYSNGKSVSDDGRSKHLFHANTMSAIQMFSVIQLPDTKMSCIQIKLVIGHSVFGSLRSLSKLGISKPST